MSTPDRDKPVIRRARIGDRERLRRMQARAFRILGRGDYTDAEIDAFLTHLGTMDDFMTRACLGVPGN